MNDESRREKGFVREGGPSLKRHPTIQDISWWFGSLLHHSASSRLNEVGWPRDQGVRGGDDVGLSDLDPPRPPSNVKNPVLTARDVTDYGNVDGVADPFLFVTEDGSWHMFLEVFNRNRHPTAVIGYATSPDGGYTWEYERVVLAEDIHLTFPYVFESEGTHYMVPDPWYKNSESTAFHLYEARDFPHGWTDVATIVASDCEVHDCIVFQWEDRWWAILGDGRDLYAYSSSTLRADEWEPHDQNPIVRDRPSAARPGGNPIVRESGVLVFYQDCEHQYGDNVRAFEITGLSQERYSDELAFPSPFVAGTGATLGWNSGKMHHVSPMFDGSKWLIAVDGNIGTGRTIFGDNWSIGIYEVRSSNLVESTTATP